LLSSLDKSPILTDLIKQTRAAKDNLTKAADDLVKNGPDEKRKEKLQDALEDALGLVDATSSMVPALPDTAQLRSIQENVDDPKKPVLSSF